MNRYASPAYGSGGFESAAAGAGTGVLPLGAAPVKSIARNAAEPNVNHNLFRRKTGLAFKARTSDRISQRREESDCSRRVADAPEPLWRRRADRESYSGPIRIRLPGEGFSARDLKGFS